LPEYQLAPLHREAAGDLLRAESRSSETLSRIIDLIQEFELQRVAGYPVALLYLCRHSTDTDLSVAAVWRGILEELLTEPDAHRRRVLRSERDVRFAATARVAAVLALSNSEQVIDHSCLRNVPTLADIFPVAADGSDRRIAAREAFNIGPFRNTAEGGYSFQQRNVRDWLAAFGLAGLALGTLRSALCDAQNRVFPRHQELLPLLGHVAEDNAVRDWIRSLGGGLPLPSDLAGPALSDSVECIDRLETLAIEAPSAIHAYDASLYRLNVPGLGNELAARLQDPDRHAAAKELLLHIALATDPYPVLPIAVEIAADAHQPVGLREWALILVVQHGGDADFRQLADPVGRSTGQSCQEQRLRAGVIRHLVERRLWSVAEAAAHAPPAEPHVVDDRHMLLRLIQERMSVDDARTLLRDRSHATAFGRLMIDPFHGLNLLTIAAHKLLEERELSAADQATLTDLALGSADSDHLSDLAFRVLDRLRAIPEIRRRFFEHGVQTWKRDATGKTWRFALQVDDVKWLLSRARHDWMTVPYVWEELYQLSRASKDANQLDSPMWEEVCRLIAAHAPDVPGRFEEDVQARERLRLRRESEMEEREEQRPIPLADEVIRLLDQKDLSVEDRMRELSCICFEAGVRWPTVVGRWEDLDAHLQRHVRAALREGLEQGSATSFAYGKSFSGYVLGEARAFLETLKAPEQVSWLVPERVQRWLPSAVFALHGELPYLTRRCAEVDLPGTRAIVLEAAEQELRSGLQYAIRASEIPLEWWSNPDVTTHVVGWVQEESFSTEARIHLLELLAIRAPDLAGPIAASWFELSPVQSETTNRLRWAGLNCRLVLDPDGAWPLIEETVNRLGREALEGIPALYQRHGQLRVNLVEWPTKRLESLGRLLLNAFPVSADPDQRGGSVTPAVELRNVRDQVVSLLLDRDTPEARSALKRLAGSDAGLQRRLRRYRARRRAEKIISVLPATAAEDESSVPLVEAVRLLDRTDYRLIRSADDLLDAALLVLREIERDVAADLALLYGRPPGKKNRAGEWLPRRHLDEDALQTYVRRRLLDLLPRHVREVRVQFLREDKVRFRRRLDLRVVAPCLNSREFATLIIELKWSDNPETGTNLVKQLAQKYLLGEQLSHGIYLVGWCGKWKQPGRAKLNRTDRKALEAYLIAQRDQYRAAGRGKDLRIETVVLGLEWSDPADQLTRTSRPRAPLLDGKQKAGRPGDTGRKPGKGRPRRTKKNKRSPRRRT
jgi:hypothetical protein